LFTLRAKARTYRKILPSIFEKILSSKLLKKVPSEFVKKVVSKVGKNLPSESQKKVLDFYTCPFITERM